MHESQGVMLLEPIGALTGAGAPWDRDKRSESPGVTLAEMIGALTGADTPRLTCGFPVSAPDLGEELGSYDATPVFHRGRGISGISCPPLLSGICLNTRVSGSKASS